jgi:hypothetical protein
MNVIEVGREDERPIKLAHDSAERNDLMLLVSDLLA